MYGKVRNYRKVKRILQGQGTRKICGCSILGSIYHRKQYGYRGNPRGHPLNLGHS